MAVSREPPSGPAGSGEAEQTRAFAPRSLHKIDFNLMIPLHALLVEANVTRAAERTKVNQPAMSASLARLRRHFGDELLVRNGREFELTPFARSLVDEVGEVLERMHAVMNRQAVVDPKSIRRTFSIVTSDYVWIVLLKRFMSVLAEEAPHVRLEVRPPVGGVARALRRARTDLVLAPSGVAREEFEHLESAPLFTDDLLVAADESNPLAGTRITRDELVRQRFLVFAKPLMEAALPDASQVRATVSTGGGYLTVTMQLLAGTQMVCLLQRKLFDLFGAAIGLREVEVDCEIPPLNETMYWHPRYLGDHEHRWLRDRLAEVAATL